MTDGNRIDSRQRGNAHQLHEKYKAMARDAQMQGDRVQAEYYLQFADHYFRLLAEQRPRQDDPRARQREDARDDRDRDDDIEDDDGDDEPGEIAGLPGRARVAAHRDGGHRDGGRGYAQAGVNGADEGQEHPARPRQAQRQPVDIRYDAEDGEPTAEVPPARRPRRTPAAEAAPAKAAASETPPAADGDAVAPRRRGRPPRRPVDDAVPVDA